MKKNISMLLVEDNKMDAKLIMLHLEKGGFSSAEIDVVDTEPEYRKALKKRPEVILSDFKLPEFNGMLALKIRNEVCRDVPFIIVTGSDKEESAIECIIKGADDYVLKSHRDRLATAIINAIKKKKTEKVNEILIEITDVALDLTNINVVLEFFYKKVNELMCAENMYIAIYNKYLKKYDFLYYKDTVDTVDTFTGADSDKSFSEYVRNLGHACLLDTQKQEELLSKGLIEVVGTRPNEWIGVPLRYNGEIIGIFSIQNYTDKNVYDAKDLEYLDRLSSTLAMILARYLSDAEASKKNKAIENSPAITMITDAKGNIEYINPAFEKITGFRIKSFLHKDLSVFKAGGDDDELYTSISNAIKNGQGFAGVFKTYRKDRSRFWASINMSPVKDNNGNITNFIIISLDVTAQKNVELKLLDALKKAEESDRLKANFLAVMSHEIRTPLNQILGFSELLATQSGLSQQDKNEYSNMVLMGGHRFLLLMTNILEMAKVESESYEINVNKVDLRKAMSKLHAEYQNVIKQERKSNLFLAFIPDKSAPKYFYTDEEKLILIISNLLDNAVKFTHEGSIAFGYNYIKKDDDTGYFEFFVKDTGIGIDKKFNNIIFEKFRQADERKIRNYEGQGLGLAICGSYAKILGGEISFVSERDKGSEFKVVIPENIENHSEPLKKSRKWEQMSLQQLKSVLPAILTKKMVVFRKTIDEIKKFELWVKLLEIPAEIICDKEKFISFIEKNGDVTLVAIDIDSNITEGRELIKEVKNKFPNKKIIAVLGHSLSVDYEMLVKEGVDDFLTKPVNISNIERIILKYFVTQ